MRAGTLQRELGVAYVPTCKPSRALSTRRRSEQSAPLHSEVIHRLFRIQRSGRVAKPCEKLLAFRSVKIRWLARRFDLHHTYFLTISLVEGYCHKMTKLWSNTRSNKVGQCLSEAVFPTKKLKVLP